MDELKITSKFMTKIVSKIVEVILKKKLGYKIDIQVNRIDATFDDGKAHFGVDLEGSLDQNEFVKLMKVTGLEN